MEKPVTSIKSGPEMLFFIAKKKDKESLYVKFDQRHHMVLTDCLFDLGYTLNVITEEAFEQQARGPLVGYYRRDAYASSHIILNTDRLDRFIEECQQQTRRLL